MQLTEHVARYLEAHGLPCCTGACLPVEPDEAIAIVATDLRPPADSMGSRFQVLARGKPGEDSALDVSSRVMSLLVGFCGLYDPESPLILRTRLEGGAAKIDTDAKGRITYSMNYRVWHI
ncbi:MAG: hypothetical protein J6J81_05725 [Oscillospiraceae bacterium]|nr:hypothetical protein [Oscillospiraceae bacterium]